MSKEDYIAKHGLEHAMSDALYTVLQERPDDGLARLAELLTAASATKSGERGAVCTMLSKLHLHNCQQVSQGVRSLIC